MRYFKSKQFIFDAASLVGLFLLSAFLIFFYFSASNINVTYPDWMVQAFRIKELQLHGMTSWTHVWSNGINFWKSYQFIPQLTALGVVQLFHVSVTRAMILVVIAQFILLRMIVYICARLLKFSTFTSLSAALVTFSIAYFWKAVGDYSLLFALTFFPVMILLWVKYLDGKFKNFFPYLCGLMFYVHPILAIVSFSMWGIAQFFTNNRIISKHTFFQLALFLAGSSLFWVPLVFKQSYSSSTSYLATKEFLKISLDPLPNYGLSISLIILFFAGFAQQFFSIQKIYSWVKVFYLFIFLYFLLIYIGIKVSLPSFINQFQYTRGVGLLGIGIIFSILPLVERLLAKKSLFINACIATVLTIIFVEGVWITSLYSPGVLKVTNDPVATFQNQNKIDTKNERIWTSTLDLSSYFSVTNSYKFPTSYMAHLESNQLPERLNQLITYRPFLANIPISEISRINDYFMLTGVKYVFLEEGSSFIPILSDEQSGYKNLGRVIVSGGIYRVFQTPWKTRNAILVNPEFENQMIHFPFNLSMSNPADQIALDGYVKNFASIVYNPVNTKLNISYPTDESIKIQIPKARSREVFINESYDEGWQATFNKTNEPISPVGPNFILVTLMGNKAGILILQHNRPLYYWFSVFIIALALVGIIYINTKDILVKLYKNIKKRSK